MYKDRQVNQKVTDFMADKRILIGKITTAHGIKGHVKVQSYVEDERLLEHPDLYTSTDGAETIKLTLKNPMKDFWLAEVDDVKDRNGAEALRGTELYIDRGALPETDDDQYYIEDMKGLKVVDRQGTDIGIILDVVNFGASDLIDIRPGDGGQNFYLPFTDETVLKVDFNENVVLVEMPEGVR